MLRARLADELKLATKARDQRARETVRLILAALKDRDIAARGKGNNDGIGEAEILDMLQKMVKQREEAIPLYEQGGRLELAEQERQEIAIIQGFMPKQLGEAETLAAVAAAIEALGAKSIKDMGRLMAALRERHAGEMDFARASAIAKERLG
jgi:uncharacterized protein